MKKVFLKILQNSQKETPVPEHFFKLQTLDNFINKEALAQVFTYEFRKIFIKTFFVERFQWLCFEYVFIFIILCYC